MSGGRNATREAAQRAAVMHQEAMQDLSIRTRQAATDRAASLPISRRLPTLSFSGYESNALFHNRGDGTFEDIGVASGAGRREDGRAVAVVDLDRDGRLDLVIANFYRRPVVILRNQGIGDGAWLGVRLRGTRSNRFGVGARVTLRSKERQWVQEVSAGNGLMSSQPSELHFGLGATEEVSMSILWPGGELQEFPRVEPRAFVTATEGDPKLQREDPRTPKPPKQASVPRPLRAGDAMPAKRLWSPAGDQSVELQPASGHTVLILFSVHCLQCKEELTGAAALERQASSLPGTQVVWAKLDDGEAGSVLGPMRDQPFFLLDAKTQALLLGPGDPPLPIAFVVSPERIEAKYVGKQAAHRAVNWIKNK